MLGYEGDKNRLDMSRYLLHLTRGGYEEAISILYENKIVPGPSTFGSASLAARGIEDKQRAVCFSEIPLGFLQQLLKRRSLYGIGFSKEFAIKNGAVPVWYLPAHSESAKSLKVLMKESTYRKGRLTHAKVEKPVWNLTPFIEIQRPRVNWQWEREWRVPGLNGFEFKNEDVAFLLIPESQHENARTFFDNFYSEHSRPSFHCIYIDARWDVNRIKEAVKQFGRQ